MQTSRSQHKQPNRLIDPQLNLLEKLTKIDFYFFH